MEKRNPASARATVHGKVAESTAALFI